MHDTVTLDEMRKEITQVREFYKDALSGYHENEFDNVTWYSNALDVIHGLGDLYGDRCSFHLEDIRPNTIATQPNISKEKYDLFGGMLEKVGWKIFPVPTIYSPEMNSYIQLDGHTRARLFLEAGKSYMPSYILRAPEEFLRRTENTAILNGIYGRPMKVMNLPIQNWGINELEAGYRRWLRAEKKRTRESGQT